MNIDRKMLAEVMIMLAVCVGAWMIFIQPKIAEISALELAIDTAKSNPALSGRAEIERMASSMEATKIRIREITDQNILGLDSSKMYGRITSLAKEHGVTLQNLDPGATANQEDAPVRRTSFTMQFDGRYRQVADFIEAVKGIDGFVSPTTLSLSPKGEEGSAFVDARFSCQAVSFKIPEVLLTLMEDGHADG